MTTRKFGRHLVSDAKKIVRADLYKNFKRLLAHPLAKPTVLMLPGEHPSEELRAVRSLWPHVHITAFDRHRSAVRAALAAGADEAIHGELKNVNQPGARGYLRPRVFDVMNLDLCGTLYPGIPLRQAAARASHYVSVFVSYGRDRAALFRSLARDWRRRRPDSPVASALARLHDSLLGRVLHIQERTGLSTLLRVYLYKGNSHPMLGVVLSRWEDEKPWTPFVYRALGRTLLDEAATTALERGTAWGTQLYGVDGHTLEALRAARQVTYQRLGMACDEAPVGQRQDAGRYLPQVRLQAHPAARRVEERPVAHRLRAP